jgi:hypothetical protein
MGLFDEIGVPVGRSVQLGRGTRLALFVVALAASSFVALGAIFAGADALAFPSSLASHPVPASAVVTDSFINGLGGEPAVNYTYSVNGKVYRGWGDYVPGGGDLLSVRPGTTIPIQYALDDPANSCTCDAAHEDFGWKGALRYFVFILPLVIMIGVVCRTSWRRWWLGAVPRISPPAA